MSGPRVAVIGYGAVCVKHAEVLRALGAELVAACNRSEAGRQRARTECGIQETYADPLEMVERAAPDALLVTPSVLSLYDVLKQVIPLGLPILAEKPPGTSLAEATELAGLADRHGTRVMVGLNRRFYSVYRRALEHVGGRAALTRVSVEWSEDPAAYLQHGHPPALIPRLNFANSLHGLDLLTCFGGPLSRAKAWGRDLDRSSRLPRWQMSLDAVSDTGLRAHFDSTWDAPGRWRLLLDAESARIVSAPLETARVSIAGRPEIEIEPDPEDRLYKPGFHAQARAFLGGVRDEAPIEWPACSLAESVRSMELAALVTDACSSEGSSAP